MRATEGMLISVDSELGVGKNARTYDWMDANIPLDGLNSWH